MTVGLGSTQVTAITREQLRNQMETSMMGRRAGMDVNGYEVGEQDTRLPIDNMATTAAGQTMSPNGFSIISCTINTSAVYALTGAVSGIYKQITQISSSTSPGFTVQFGPNAQIVTTLGTSFNQITFAGAGHTVNLACVASGTSLGSSSGGGGLWVATAAFTTASGLSLSTY